MKVDLRSSRWNQSLKLKIARGAWIFCWWIISKGPRLFSPVRVAVLRFFGAKIGKHVLVCSGVKVLMPWNLEISDVVAIGEGVNIYNFSKVSVATQTTISQGVILCTGSHDYLQPHFPLISQPISIGKECWVAMEAFVFPGVEIGDRSIVGARAAVTKSIPGNVIVGGNPAKYIKDRSDSSK